MRYILHASLQTASEFLKTQQLKHYGYFNVRVGKSLQLRENKSA
jgi:hypothetical protein